MAKITESRGRISPPLAILNYHLPKVVKGDGGFQEAGTDALGLWHVAICDCGFAIVHWKKTSAKTLLAKSTIIGKGLTMRTGGEYYHPHFDTDHLHCLDGICVIQRTITNQPEAMTEIVP